MAEFALGPGAPGPLGPGPVVPFGPAGAPVPPPGLGPVGAPALGPVNDYGSADYGDYGPEDVHPFDDTIVEDYTYWRYSRVALPLLLLILGIFVALIILTMWQSRSDVRRLRPGVPRDLEPPSSVTAREGGVPKFRRNLRIAATFLGILFSLAAILVFRLAPKPVMRAKINYLLGGLLIIVSIIAWIAFALDVNSERDAVECTTNVNQSRVCESRENLATAATVFDALLGLFALTAGILVIAYTASGDWARYMPDYREGLAYGGVPYDAVPGATPNGVSYVRKSVTMIALVLTFLSAVILLVFTVLLHEARERFTLRDQFNRPVNELPGWPRENTRLRYAVGAFVIVTVLFNLIPLTSRVIAYILAFLYLLYAVMSFVAFGFDINSIGDARELQCPDNLSCVFHPYIAVAALDFLGGFFLLVYIAVEYVVMKNKKAKAAAAAADAVF